MSDDMALLPICLILHQRQRARLHDRRRRLFLLYLAHLMVSDSIRGRHYLRSQDLLPQHRVPWYQTYSIANDDAFLEVVGLNVAGFHAVLLAFDREYVVLSGPGQRGRPRRFAHKHATLACLLHMYRSGAGLASLASHFGVPPATLSRNLRAAEQALGRCIRKIPEARILWPTFEQQRVWGDLVSAKEPLIKGCWGFIDGKNYPVAHLVLATYRMHTIMVRL